MTTKFNPAINFDATSSILGRIIVEEPFRVIGQVSFKDFVGGAFTYISPGTYLDEVEIG
jgi:hypothetical protein